MCHNCIHISHHHTFHDSMQTLHAPCPTTSTPDPPHICAVAGRLCAGSVVYHRRTSVAEEIESLSPSVVLCHFTADHSRYSLNVKRCGPPLAWCSLRYSSVLLSTSLWCMHCWLTPESRRRTLQTFWSVHFHCCDNKYECISSLVPRLLVGA